VRPDALIAFFTDDPAVVAVGADFLHIISFNFVASGIVFTCSGMFQALGNTVPSLVASATRIITFALPAVWLSRQPWFELRHLWYVSVCTVALQAVVAWWMLARVMDDKLARMPR
jgi:Na+-driven multidrug efflux pump